MSNKADIITTLRQYLDCYVLHQNRRFEVIEVLEEKPALVLQDCERRTTIQADQHGEAHRRVPQIVTITIPVDDHGDYDISGVDIERLDSPGV